MRIRCASMSLPQDLESPRLAKLPGRWPVALGSDYEVLALSQEDSLWYVTFEHHEQEMPVSAPLALFDVLDPGVPRTWNVRVKSGAVCLQPVEFDDEVFCDDVQERRGNALERYRDMKSRLSGHDGPQQLAPTGGDDPAGGEYYPRSIAFRSTRRLEQNA